jgi:hypothetical protein
MRSTTLLRVFMILAVPAIGGGLLFTSTATICDALIPGQDNANCTDRLLVQAQVTGLASADDTVLQVSLPSTQPLATNGTDHFQASPRQTRRLAFAVPFAAIAYRLREVQQHNLPVIVPIGPYISRQACEAGNAATVCCKTSSGLVSPAQTYTGYRVQRSAQHALVCGTATPPSLVFNAEFRDTTFAESSLMVSISERVLLNETTWQVAPGVTQRTSLQLLSTLPKDYERTDLQVDALCRPAVDDGSSKTLRIPQFALASTTYLGLQMSDAAFVTGFQCPQTQAEAASIVATASVSPAASYFSRTLETAFMADAQCHELRAGSNVASRIASPFPSGDYVVVQCAAHSALNVAASISDATGAMVIRRYARPVITDAGALTSTDGPPTIFVDVTNDNEVEGTITVRAAAPQANSLCSARSAIAVQVATPIAATMVLKAYATTRFLFSVNSAAWNAVGGASVDCDVAIDHHGVNMVPHYTFTVAVPTTRPPSTPTTTPMRPSAPPGTGLLGSDCDESSAAGCTNVECAIKYALAVPPRTVYDTTSHACVPAAACLSTERLDTDTNTCVPLNHGEPPAPITPAPGGGNITGPLDPTIGAKTICVHGNVSTDGDCVCEVGYTSDGAQRFASVLETDNIALCNNTASRSPEQPSANSGGGWWSALPLVGAVGVVGVVLLLLLLLCCCGCGWCVLKRCCRCCRREKVENDNEADVPSSPRPSPRMPGGSSQRRRGRADSHRNPASNGHPEPNEGAWWANTPSAYEEDVTVG